jgi:hypothetical protein
MNPVLKALVLTAMIIAGDAAAQSYPSKPIRIVVPYPAGGTSDILARAIGQKLSDAWGQPVVVDNKPGANGNVGADIVAKAPATGTRCCLPTSAASRSVRAFIDAAVRSRQGFRAGFDGRVFAAYPRRPSVGARLVGERMVALAKSKPGMLNFADSGSAARLIWRASTSRCAMASTGCTSRTRAARRRSPTLRADRRT